MTMNPSPTIQTAAAQRTRNNARRRKRWLPWLCGALFLALVVLGFLPQPTPVETARVSPGSLRATVNEEGKTRIKQRYAVSAPVTGRLRRISFKEGAAVQAGQTVLAVIDPLPPAMLDARARAQADARRDAAKADMEKARVAHQFEASELQRFQKLYADQAVAVRELESAQWRDASTARELASAESTLRQVEAELADFALLSDGATTVARAPLELKAPASGVVLRLLQESARIVTAGTLLLEIGDPADLEVVVEVLSRDGAAMAPGAKVELEQWGAGPPLAARVRLIEPAAFTKVSALGVEEQRLNVVADITTPREQRLGLGDGFRVEARIVVWEADAILKVPVGALFRRGQEWAAFVHDSGRARLRRVQAGRSSGSEMQILGGLKEGEEVILYPGDRVRDGQKVKPIKI